MAVGYYLNEKDKALLRQLKQESNTTLRNPPRIRNANAGVPGTGLVERADGNIPPEVYIALPPPGGIPAITRSVLDAPGTAVCDIYRIDNSGDIVPVSSTFNKTVYNLSDEIVPEDWTVVTRDKYGRWIAVLTAGSPIAIVRVDETGTSIPSCEDVTETAECLWHGFIQNPVVTGSPAPQCGDPYTEGQAVWLMAINKCKHPTTLKKNERYIAFRIAASFTVGATTKPLFALKHVEPVGTTVDVVRVTDLGSPADCDPVNQLSECVWHGVVMNPLLGVDQCGNPFSDGEAVWLMDINHCDQPVTLNVNERYLALRIANEYTIGPTTKPLYALKHVDPAVGQVDVIKVSDAGPTNDCENVNQLSQCVWHGRVVSNQLGADQCGNPFSDGENVWLMDINHCTTRVTLRMNERYLALRMADEYTIGPTTKPLYALRDPGTSSDTTRIVTPLGAVCEGVTRDGACLFDGREASLDLGSADMCDRWSESATSVWIITMNECPQEPSLMQKENFFGRLMGTFDPGGDSRPLYAINGNRETHRVVSVVDDTGTPAQDCKTPFAQSDASCVFDGRIHNLDLSSNDLCDRWAEQAEKCWILPTNSCPKIEYLNKSDRFLGRYMGHWDPGTDNRPVYAVDGNRTHIINFTLLGPISGGQANAVWNDGPPAPDDEVIVYDPEGLFPRTKTGSVGYAARDMQGRYLVSNVQQIAHEISVVLDGDMLTTDATGGVKTNIAGSLWHVLDDEPTALKPTTIGTAQNNYGLEGLDGDRAIVRWSVDLAAWVFVLVVPRIEKMRFVSVVDDTGTPVQDCKTPFAAQDGNCLFDGRIHNLDLQSVDVCDKWSESADKCWILTANDCPKVAYLNKTDRFLGRFMGNFDPGSDDRPVYAIDGERTHMLAFTLTEAIGDTTAGQATATWDGAAAPPPPDDEIIVHDPQGLFPRTKVGSKGYACRDVEGRYLITNVQQIAKELSVVLASNLDSESSSGTVKDDTGLDEWYVMDEEPFGLKPGSVGNPVNRMALEGATDDRAEIRWNTTLDQWEFIQIQHKIRTLMTQIRWNEPSLAIQCKTLDIVVMTNAAESDWFNCVQFVQC